MITYIFVIKRRLWGGIFRNSLQEQDLLRGPGSLYALCGWRCSVWSLSNDEYAKLPSRWHGAKQLFPVKPAHSLLRSFKEQKSSLQPQARSASGRSMSAWIPISSTSMKLHKSRSGTMARTGVHKPESHPPSWIIHQTLPFAPLHCVHWLNIISRGHTLWECGLEI